MQKTRGTYLLDQSKGFSKSITWFKFLVIGVMIRVGVRVGVQVESEVVLSSSRIISCNLWCNLLYEMLHRNVESMLHAPRN